MTPEERQVITGIFERLRAAENRPRDPEAERLIGELVAAPALRALRDGSIHLCE